MQVLIALSLMAAYVPQQGTFSVAAYDPKTGDLGVAVASRVLAVGSVVPCVKAGVGAIATQAFANTTYGPNGLAMLAKGKSAEEVVKALTAADKGRDQRQLGIVDAKGRSFNYTGKKCMVWCGGVKGQYFTCQGNILTGADVPKAMAEAFQNTKGELAERLYAAIVAGDSKGGDKRGRQSAAIVVCRKGAGYAGFDDRYVDLRVDDAPEPIVELGRLLKISLGQRLEARANAFYEQKKWAEADAEYKKLLARDPSNANYLYNYACVLALWGKKPGAISTLKQSIELDDQYRALAKEDPDFTSLRGTDEFKKLLNGE